VGRYSVGFDMQSTNLLRSWLRRLMTGVLWTSLLAPAQLAQAQEMQGVLENRTPLGSINFIANEGQIVSYSTFSGGGASSSHFNDAGIQTGTSRTTSYSWGQTLGYGVTNDIEISFKDNYSTSSSHYSPVSGSSSSSESDGFADPTFTVLWRAVNQGRGYPVNLDLSAAYAPDLWDAKSASSAFDGTVARGGGEFIGTAALSHSSNANIYYISFSAIDSSERNILVQPLSSPYNQRLGDYWQYSFNVAYQHYFDEKLSASIGFQYYSSDSYGIVNQGGNDLVYSRNTGPQYQPNIALNYAFVPNQVVGSLGYTHVIASKVDTAAPSDPAKSSSTRDGQSDTVSATLRLLFR
jgi:hypothetical protein